MPKKGGYWIIEDSQSFCACQMNAQQCKYWWLALHKNSLEYSQMEPELGTVFCFLISTQKNSTPNRCQKGRVSKTSKVSSRLPDECTRSSPSQSSWLVGWFIANPTLHNPLGPLSNWHITLKLYLKWKQGLKTAAPGLNLLGGSSMRHGGEGCKVCSISESGHHWGKRVGGH